MTFHGADLGWLIERREQGAMLLEFLLDTLPVEDVNVVECARLLGALDAELLRRDGICQALIACRYADQEA